ncbi:MAG: hypothetical protein QG578_1452, partial [Thermodesulfobacteriota bacterium]|nr:hypothetical protein [Thermodesulfobacteriota bacterium]
MVIKPDSENIGYIDAAGNSYKRKRIENWGRAAIRKKEKRGAGKYYHNLLRHYYRFVIPPGLKVLELGCGHGDFLSSVEPA